MKKNIAKKDEMEGESKWGVDKLEACFFNCLCFRFTATCIGDLVVKPLPEFGMCDTVSLKWEL